MDKIICADDFENYAQKLLPKGSFDYYSSGALSGQTVKNNIIAFSRYRIRPKCLRNVSHRDISTTILGTKILMPIGIAPTAMQKVAHPDGELASARVAQEMGTVFILSTLSTTSIEDVAKAAPLAVKWFQIYIYKNREITKNLVKRAEDAGFKAIVLTVDSPVNAIRRSDIYNKFCLAPHLKFENFVGSKAADFNTTEGFQVKNAITDFDSTLEWKDVVWLQQITNLPIILKGILTAEDAIIAANLNVSGILVSNHGGRQLDSVPASIEALPEIVKAIGDVVEVYLDGGIREGTSIFKALALGAKMVFLGRPVIWGLTCGGEAGIKKMFDILRMEFDNTMALSGISYCSYFTVQK